MNGGANEHTASYVNNGSQYLSTSGGTASGDLYGDTNERATSTAYKMVYEGTGTQNTDYETAKKYKGDVIYETSNNYGNSTGSWFSVRANFPFSDCPFFTRSGRFDGNDSGLFLFGCDRGIRWDSACLSVWC